MPAQLAQQANENLQTSQVLETCEVSGPDIFSAHYADLAEKILGSKWLRWDNMRPPHISRRPGEDSFFDEESVSRVSLRVLYDIRQRVRSSRRLK